MSETIKYQVQMDACRPGSNDLCQDELTDAAGRIHDHATVAEAFRRSQEWDKSVGEIVRGGQVPENLADSILESVRVSGRTVVSNDIELQGDTRREQRRYLLWGSGLLSLATVAGLMIFWGWQSATPRRLTRGHLLASVERWIVQPDSEWQLLTEQELARFSMDAGVNFHPDRWQSISLGTGNDAIVYSDQFAQRESLYLFVVEIGTAEVAALPSNPPRTADWNSQGWYVGVWKRDHLVYALAVKGSSGREYKQLLRPVRIG